MATPVNIRTGVRDDGSAVLNVSGELDMSNVESFNTAIADAMAPDAPANFLINIGATQSLAVRAHKALGCSGASRVDLILSDTGRAVCLEINTLPGMTDHSLLPKIAAHRGMDYATLVERILASASLHA